MKGAVFESKLERSLLRIAAQANGARAAKTPFRHCLFVGPPGTGKTLFAKRLAAHARMDYAVMSGGDVAPLGKRRVVTDMHKMFDWAERSPNGLLLLDRRGRRVCQKAGQGHVRGFEECPERVSVPNGNAVHRRHGRLRVESAGAVRQRGPRSSGRDRAVPLAGARRKKEDPPGVCQGDARALASDELFPTGAAAITLDDGVTDDMIIKAADKCEGFSARELSKLALAWRAAAFATEERVLTPSLVEETLNLQLGQRRPRVVVGHSPSSGSASATRLYGGGAAAAGGRREWLFNFQHRISHATFSRGCRVRYRYGTLYLGGKPAAASVFQHGLPPAVVSSPSQQRHRSLSA